MTRIKRIVILVCILSGAAALAPPPVVGQSAGDFGSGYGTKFIYRKPFRYNLDPAVLDNLVDSLGYVKSTSGNVVIVEEGIAGRGLVRIDTSKVDTVIYVIDNGPATVQLMGAANYSNVSGNDSTQFNFNGVTFSGFLLPISATYPAVFERFAYKTNVNGSDAEHRNFSANRCASSDSSSFSVHIDSEGSGGSRTYWLRVYKHQTSSYNGLSVPLTTGTLILSEQLDVALSRFPTHGTSVQIRLTIWIRRL